jgi:5-methylcytosine-specific restriction enzyme subunit McrC
MLVPTISPEQAKTIPIRNVWYLLLYAWDLGHWKGLSSAAAEDSPNLLGLLTRLLADSVDTLLRRQLGREFHTETSEIRGIRGKVHLTASIRRLSFEAGKAVCTYPRLGVDTPRNRILKATLHRLMNDPRLKDGASDKQVGALRDRVRAAVQAMDGVRLVRLQGSDFSRLCLGRNDSAYSVPMKICELIYRLELPLESEGDSVVSALLRDEKEFWRVFEHFVRNFYRSQLKHCRVWKEPLKWPDELGAKYVPGMETDVSIETLSSPYRRVVFETKYYGNSLAEGFGGGEKFLSGHLYQLYAYLRTQADRQEPKYGNARGVLLYPHVGKALDEEMRVQGHTIWVCTLDLAQRWQDIEERLLELADRALEPQAVEAMALRG